MFVNYLKYVSVLLAMIRSVRECNTEMHLEAERALLPQLFALGHPNYSRYLAYQHTLLEVHRISNLGIDPFSSRPAKNIKSGVLLHDLIVKGLLKSDEVGEKHLKDFILKRIKVKENDSVSLIAPIKNPKLKTRFEVTRNI